MKYLTTLLAGILFGIGLILSGMTNPTKIQNFFDVFGSWDASLAFVMVGAIAVTLPGFRLARKRATPLYSEVFSLPTRTDIDSRLVIGAATFGLGWGLSGFCPGPAITSMPMGISGTLVFVPAMLVGMIIAKTYTRHFSSTPTHRSKAHASI